MLTYIAFIAGFLLLIKGADMLVAGASTIARRFHVSDLMIGLTIVSSGTSAPELVVNLVASLRDSSALALGNVIGSNIANILLILGFTSLVAPLAVGSSTIWKEIPFSLLAVVILAIIANDSIFSPQQMEVASTAVTNTTVNSATANSVIPKSMASAAMTSKAATLGNWISRGDGLILLAFFAVFLYYTFSMQVQIAEPGAASMPLWRAILWVVIGLAGLALGGEWIVNGAVQLAELLGLSPTLIGIFIVGVGTSLPELAASGVAAARGNTGIAIGNAVGSNIFNIFWVLGLSAVVQPIAYDSSNNIDLLVILMASLALFFAIFFGRRHQLYRWEGVSLLLLYVAYLLIRLTLLR